MLLSQCDTLTGTPGTHETGTHGQQTNENVQYYSKRCENGQLEDSRGVAKSPNNNKPLTLNT